MKPTLKHIECVEPEKQFIFNDRNDKQKENTSTIQWVGKNK